jgi:putative intracellular protease/amidase
MPGGDIWERESHEDLIKLLHQFQTKSTIIAAICGATLEIARAGLMHGLRHTSNSKGYLKAMIPDYRDDEFYVDKLAIADITHSTALRLSKYFGVSPDFGLNLHPRWDLYLTYAIKHILTHINIKLCT